MGLAASRCCAGAQKEWFLLPSLDFANSWRRGKPAQDSISIYGTILGFNFNLSTTPIASWSLGMTGVDRLCSYYPKCHSNLKGCPRTPSQPCPLLTPPPTPTSSPPTAGFRSSGQMCCEHACAHNVRHSTDICHAQSTKPSLQSTLVL